MGCVLSCKKGSLQVKTGNTMNNIKQFVSRNKRRFQQDGFDLDLAYITPRIIAMGFPAQKIEGVFRNHIDDVHRFLEKYHKDRYKLYNLCSERHYDVGLFHGRVAKFPFDDHNPPKMELIKPFCEDVQTWLDSHEENVVAIHCKAGKGRTGVMICAYLLHSKAVNSAEEALSLYAKERTFDTKGVTIPSQRRYVEYYEALVNGGHNYHQVSLELTSVILSPTPSTNGANIYFVLLKEKEEIFRSDFLDFKSSSRASQQGSFSFILPKTITLSGDIEFKLIQKELVQKKKKLFSFWFNTFFVLEPWTQQTRLNCDKKSIIGPGQPLLDCRSVNGHAGQRDASINSDQQEVRLILTKDKLDGATSKQLSKDFSIELFFKKSLREPSSSVGMNGSRNRETSSSDTEDSEEESDP